MQAASDRPGALPQPDRPQGRSPRARRSLPLWGRPLWQLVRVALAALVAYAIWRAYQNPDLLLDFAALRLC